ncbi:hypothetical protein ACFFYR_15170, partial [Paraburkholderia dipogonis]|uniref:hypothetical protein n=1 Tax=Paraburkholderia dipogonis TaxID=1211383 RepID=UPI0035E6E75C
SSGRDTERQTRRTRDSVGSGQTANDFYIVEDSPYRDMRYRVPRFHQSKELRIAKVASFSLASFFKRALVSRSSMGLGGR